MAQTLEPVAVLGIGAMGHGMATSALRAGIPTIVWNRAPETTRDLAEAGAVVAENAADAARRAGTRSRAWPTNGNTPSITDSLTRTSPS